VNETNRSRHEPLCRGFIPPGERGQFGVARHRPFFELSSHGLVMNGLHCQGKQGKRGPGSPLRINIFVQEDLLRMLKTVIQPPPPPLSPTSLTDKPLGAGGRGTEAEKGGLLCVCSYGCMCIYMKCVSTFLEGLSCMQTQGRRGTHERKTHTLKHAHTTVQIR